VTRSHLVTGGCGRAGSCQARPRRRGQLVGARRTAPLDDPNEFWLDETWLDAAAVEQHESAEAFRRHKDALRPPVDPDSLVFDNAVR
jgi:quinol monooxygenase YgiN